MISKSISIQNDVSNNDYNGELEHCTRNIGEMRCLIGFQRHLSQHFTHVLGDSPVENSGALQRMGKVQL